jgi:hypothetical protein
MGVPPYTLLMNQTEYGVARCLSTSVLAARPTTELSNGKSAAPKPVRCDQLQSTPYRHRGLSHPSRTQRPCLQQRLRIIPALPPCI